MEKENFNLRGQPTKKLLIIKQLKTYSKSNLFPTVSTTNTITTPAQTNDNINSNNYTTITITITRSRTITAKTRTMTTTTAKIKRTIIALMKRQFTTIS